MKTIKLLFAAAIFILPQILNAQSKSDKMYDAFANKEGVSNFSFSRNMLNAINIDIGDDGKEQNVTGDLSLVRFMSYNPQKGSMGGSEFTRRAVKMLPPQYKKYVDDNDDSDAEVWLLGGKKKYSECHIFITNQDEGQMRFIVSFYGDFTVNDLDKLRETGKSFSTGD